jgi:hypothetical protein
MDARSRIRAGARPAERLKVRCGGPDTFARAALEVDEVLYE